MTALSCALDRQAIVPAVYETSFDERKSDMVLNQHFVLLGVLRTWKEADVIFKDRFIQYRFTVNAPILITAAANRVRY